MKRNLKLVCVLVGLCVLLFAGIAVAGGVTGILPALVVGIVMTLVALWVFIGSILRERLYESCELRLEKRDYAGTVALLDKYAHNHLFYPVYRTVSHQLYLRAYLALDDSAAAVRHIEILRHAGGEGWKFRTCFFLVLINLDWGETEIARTEYEAFKKACALAAAYREQLEILDVIFDRIEGGSAPLPEYARGIPYPVLHRVIDRL